MSVSAVEATRQLWSSGLANHTGKPGGGFHDWVKTATYAPNVNNSVLTLSGIDGYLVRKALAADINRLALAASETLKNISEVVGIPKSLGWPYVKLYYAAFFYAHTLLRIWGRSPSYFTTQELMRVKATLNAYDIAPPFRLSTGQYLLELKQNAGFVQLSADSSGQGSHEAAWKHFSAALKELELLSNTANYVEVDRINVIKQIQALLALITDGGRHESWLSQIRNNIQYRQSGGVWFPYSSKEKISSFKGIVEGLTSATVDLNVYLEDEGSEIERFRNACCCVILLARKTINSISEIGGRKSFLHYGQVRFENSL